jgi:hypothetical protein
MSKSEGRAVDFAGNIQELTKGPNLPVEDGSEVGVGQEGQ